jgi:hypothetical protein
MSCSICSSPRAAEVDAALASQPLRAVARRFAIPRSSLQRHAAHAGAIGPRAPAGAREHLREALALLAEAVSEREALGALASVRSSLRLELKDFRAARPRLRVPEAEHVEALRSNLEAAWEAYERVRPRRDLAARALSGVRQALDSLREAESRLPAPPEELVAVRIKLGGMEVEARWPASAAAQIPPEGLHIRWPTSRSSLGQFTREIPGSNGSHP